MKTAELTGPLLDYWVAKAEGYELDEDGDNRTIRGGGGGPSPWHPSTDWRDGGPIIERQQIKIEHVGEYWDALIVAKTADVYYQAGPTPLVAAMRAYVASKFGDELPNISDE